MANKVSVLIVAVLTFIGCREDTSYQKIRLDYASGTFQILSNNYQFDSLSIFRGDSIFYLLDLKNDKKGKNSIKLNENDIDYNVFNNLSNINGCSSLYLFVRIKKLDSKEVQYFSLNFKPCSNNSIEIGAERPPFP